MEELDIEGSVTDTIKMHQKTVDFIFLVGAKTNLLNFAKTVTHLVFR